MTGTRKGTAARCCAGAPGMHTLLTFSRCIAAALVYCFWPEEGSCCFLKGVELALISVDLQSEDVFLKMTQHADVPSCSVSMLRAYATRRSRASCPPHCLPCHVLRGFQGVASLTHHRRQIKCICKMTHCTLSSQGLVEMCGYDITAS